MTSFGFKKIYYKKTTLYCTEAVIWFFVEQILTQDERKTVLNPPPLFLAGKIHVDTSPPSKKKTKVVTALKLLTVFKCL